LLDPQPVKIPVGGTAQVRFAAAGAFGQAPLQIELSDPPEGIAVDSVTRSDQGITLVLKADPQKAKPGLKGNLIASAFSKEHPENQGWEVADVPLGLGHLARHPV